MHDAADRACGSVRADRQRHLADDDAVATDFAEVVVIADLLPHEWPVDHSLALLDTRQLDGPLRAADRHGGCQMARSLNQEISRSARRCRPPSCCARLYFEVSNRPAGCFPAVKRTRHDPAYRRGRCLVAIQAPMAVTTTASASQIRALVLRSILSLRQDRRWRPTPWTSHRPPKRRLHCEVVLPPDQRPRPLSWGAGDRQTLKPRSKVHRHSQQSP